MWLLTILLSGLALSSLILPWVNFFGMRKLRGELDAYRSQLDLIRARLDGAVSPGASFDAPPASDRPLSVDISSQSAHPAQDAPEISVPSDTGMTGRASFMQGAVPNEAASPVSMEQSIGARLPVWVGGLALALAGFFMVKYSIETGLLIPSVRIVLGTIFGIGLLVSANLIRARPSIANGVRIAQALSGAGIADLYVSIFAATTLYHLIPSYVGFVAMAGVTALAVVLSLRHGMPIAVMGLIGGFVTPALISSNDPQAPALFTYLFLVLCGFMVVIRKQLWWGMSIPTVLGAFMWVLIWLWSGNFTPQDSLYLGLFLMGVSAVVVMISHQQYDAGESAQNNFFIITRGLNYLALGGAMLLLSIVVFRAGFGAMEWCLFGLLSVGGIALAYMNQRLYGQVPWVSMGVNACMLLAWNSPGANALALVISIFGALYITSGYMLQSRSERPLVWAGLTATASIGYYLLGYYLLRNTQFAAGTDFFWSILALVFAGLGTYALQTIRAHAPVDHPQKQHLLAIYAATTTGFISAAMTIALPGEFLSVAIAAQLFAISWINTKVEVDALRYIAGILAVVFAHLLLPQILLLLQLTVYSLAEVRLNYLTSLPIVNRPIFQLGLPAVFFVLGGYLLCKRKDDFLVRGFEVAAIALLGVMGYYLVRHEFHIDENVLFTKAGFIERGLISNGIFVFGLACLWVGVKFTRRAVLYSGQALAGIALFRIGYFDLLIYNPLWSGEVVGKFPIFNGLLITYGLPILWTWRATSELGPEIAPQLRKFGYGVMLLLGFVLISFSVRQFYQGTYLNGHVTTNLEIYSYSLAWLVFGVGVLFLGTLRKDRMIRLASLAIMILTVAKVFLFDASELSGLLRVFSFFGLGLSLLGLSWFYTRFVLAQPVTPEATA